MKLKLKQITLVLAAVATAPSPAFALTPSQVGGATQLWVTGSSSAYNSVFKGMMTLCRGMKYRNASGFYQQNPGAIDVHVYYEFDPADLNKRPSNIEPGFGVGDRVAYACTVGTDGFRAGVLEGTKVVLYHTVEGGSFNAYAPALRRAGDTNVNLPTTLQRITEVADLSAPISLGGTPAGCAAGAATDRIVRVSGIDNVIPYYSKCRRTTVTLATGAVNVTGDTGPTTSVGGFSDTEYLINKLNLDIATDLGFIGHEVNTNIGQAFAVGVSYPLYAQLQKNDGIITTTVADGEACDGVYTAGACQPNLPAQVYSTVVSQAAVGSINASLFGGLATGKVNLARRGPTSGTQSASNLYFLNKPCATGEVSGAQNPARAVDSTATLIITESASTEGVKFTLNTATGKGEFALGLMSMENTPQPTFQAARWAFVKLNNVSPNSDSFQRAEAIKGNYTMWYEMWAFTAATAPQEGISLMTGINASMGNPELTNLKGLFITPLAGVSGTNVSKGTRYGNSCTPANI